MRSVWTSVQVINPKHKRNGEAGVVMTVDADKPEVVGVRFDADGQAGAVVDVKMADLRALS